MLRFERKRVVFADILAQKDLAQLIVDYVPRVNDVQDGFAVFCAFQSVMGLLRLQSRCALFVAFLVDGLDCVALLLLFLM